jgi:phage baseplate assembly protein W
MSELFHQWGSDMLLGPTGDLVSIQGTTAGQQRVLRRLLTNPGDYVWQPAYGAGLAQFIGSPTSAARIRAVVRSQIFREPAVARQPEPVIDVIFGGNGDGSVYVGIRYVDADTGETQLLSFSVGTER